MALAVSLKFNPQEVEATVVLYVKIKHPDFISGDIQRGRQGGVESYGTAGPVPLFCAIFSNCDGSIWLRAHLFECERGFWYCPIWSRAQKQEWAHSTRTWPRRGSWLPSVLLQGRCAPRANRVGSGLNRLSLKLNAFRNLAAWCVKLSC